MALTQDELDQVYNYAMGKGQSLAGLPDGGTDLSSMYLAPLLKYSPGGAATLVRLAVSLLQGESAYQVWVKVPGNEGKTLSDFFASIKGGKGDPFTYADFTPEQLEDLALTYDKLTPEQKEEMKLKFADLTEADILALQKPATDAAAEVRKEMVQISQDANAAIEAANTAAGSAQEAADNVQDGKTTQFEIGTVESGAAPSASLTDNGVDATGNPKKKLNLVMQKGDNAKSPTVQTGTITAGDPASEVTFTFAEVGMTEDGRPIWRADGSIPRGQQGPPGTGSGNVSADGTGLVTGKKYLFVPDSDGSTAGSFVEYVAPEIPEQVQSDWGQEDNTKPDFVKNKPTIHKEQVNSDWNATEGKAKILNKPGDATVDKSGLMSADQFQKLENLDPMFLRFLVEGLEKGGVGYNEGSTYIYNTTRAKKLEYTDTGDLLFEGKKVWHESNDGAGSGLDADYSHSLKSRLNIGSISDLNIVVDVDQVRNLFTDEYDRFSANIPTPSNNANMVLHIGRGIHAEKYYASQLAFQSNGLFYRTQDSDTWSKWKKIIFADDAKFDRIGSYTTATTVANLDANYENISVSLNANASLSVNAAGENYDGLEINVLVYCPSTRTITIPTSGNYESMCGSSHTCPAGRRVEFNLKCYAGIWHIAKLEQE